MSHRPAENGPAPPAIARPVDRRAIHAELEAARHALHDLLAHASAADLRRGSNGTRWTNEQLLFHMVFGYLVVRRLLPLVRLVSRCRRRPVAASPPSWTPAGGRSTS